MKNILILAVFLTFFGESFSQATRFELTNEDEEPVSYIDVYSGGKLIGRSSKEGVFRTMVRMNDTLVFTGDGVVLTYTYVATENKPKSVQITMSYDWGSKAGPQYDQPVRKDDNLFEEPGSGPNEIH